MIRVMLLLLAVLAAASAESLGEGDRNRALSELHASRVMFLNAIDGLNEAQWTYKPAADAWSIQEVAEHVALSEEKIFEFMREKVLSTEAQPHRDRGVLAEGDAKVLAGVADRSTKAKAPEYLQPEGRFATSADAAAAFEASRGATIEFARETQLDLRAHRMPNETFGELDAYQWLLLIAAHSERHVKQIQEVAGSDGFPK